MGYSQDSKAETHGKIVGAAARRLREAGLEGVGVADLMKEVGLTVGGFYKHFGSRDDLVAEALAAMGNGWDPLFAEAEARGRSDATLFDALVDGYLDVSHRDAPGDGCLFAALSSDLGRSGDKAREVATRKLDRVITRLAQLFKDRRAPAARATAIVVYSALVGAMSLARATNDEALSREILSTVGKVLKKTLRPEARAKDER
ncbi:Transcriptional regulator, TetR family protein [Minicystis rosea]|nr:Transcriptional regulator, TetR family protein [Minicystis rosea]